MVHRHLQNAGVTEQGVPWFDDLYLDVVVLRNGEVFLLDEDELDDALTRGDITREDYQLAISTAKNVMKAIDAHQFPYFLMSLEDRKRLFDNGEFRRKS